MNFEDFLTDFSTDFVNHQQFLLNAILAAALSFVLGQFYSKYGTAVSNRKQFGRIFMFLTLTTMLIIYIVKSSVALSLGLVGALSIVRFRAAIKEPEELVYLFFAIGIGLGLGANQATVTLLAYLLIMSLLVIQSMVLRKGRERSPENMFVNIRTSEIPAEDINKILSEHFKLVELRRMDQFDGQLDLSYLVETEDIAQIIKVKDQLLNQAPNLNFSFVEQRNIAV
ncbi:MAG: DUF4956 domain-containing protein [Saprospiraceae bacterium]|nr:DUF4956 domain-containing protein [Saprospiraceae bacterium]